MTLGGVKGVISNIPPLSPSSFTTLHFQSSTDHLLSFEYNMPGLDDETPKSLGQLRQETLAELASVKELSAEAKTLIIETSIELVQFQSCR